MDGGALAERPDSHEPREPEPADAPRGDDGLRDALLIAAAALLGRLPSLGAFWNRDDWTLLARATGLLETDGLPARAVSQVLYWRLLHPVFGLAPEPWAWSRLLLHAASALLVRRIARRCGLAAPAALLAGLLFAATPLAFAPLYWAAGVQDLLGGVLALLAVERLLSGGRTALLAAAVAGTLAILAKENALCLPVLAGLIALGLDRERRRGHLAVAAGLAVVAVVETLVLWRNFPHGPGTGYELAPLSAFPENLVVFGWWLATPWPFYAPQDNLFMLTAGLLVWAAWLFWSWHRWRAGDRRPAAWLAAALLALAPALVVDFRLEPRLAYLSFAPAAVLLGLLVLGARPRLRPLAAVGLAVVAAAVGWTAMETRLSARNADDTPADPLVLHTAVSHEALRTLAAINTVEGQRFVILQIEDDARRRSRLGTPSGLPIPTILHEALEGDLGHAIHGSADRSVRWVRRLDDVPLDALVFADTGPRLRYWGPVAQAFIYQMLTEVARGRHDEAVKHLVQGLRNSRQIMAFVYDEAQLPADPEALRINARGFLDRIRSTAGLNAETKSELLAAARDLLTLCNAYI